MYDETFVLSAFMQDIESGFYVFRDTEFDEFKKELERENERLKSELGFDPFSRTQFDEDEKEEFLERMKKNLLYDPFVYLNCLKKVFVKEEGIGVLFTLPEGIFRNFFIFLEKNEILYASIEFQKSIFKLNPYVLPFLDPDLIEIKGLYFFESRRKELCFKLKAEFKFPRIERSLVYKVKKSKETLKELKNKFQLHEEVREAWRDFKRNF